MNDVENGLRSCVDGFVNDLSALIRRQALQAVGEVLKKGEDVGDAPVRKPRLPPRAAAGVDAGKAARATGRAAKSVLAPKRKAGEKRTAQQLARITEQVYNHIKSNGGHGVEQIAKALATSTKEVTLPIRKLLAEKKIGSKGQKRATRYFSR